MDMINMIGIALITSIASLIIKTIKPELAFAVLIVGSLVLASVAIKWLSNTFDLFDEIAEITKIDDQIIKILLKIVGIGYLTEFSSEIIQDFGNKSLANKVELCGRIAIFTYSLPILYSLLSVISEIVKMT